MKQKAPSLFDWNIVGPAIGDSFKKLNPRLMIRNPVMFVTMVYLAVRKPNPPTRTPHPPNDAA